MVLLNYIFMAEKHFRGYHRGDLDPVSRSESSNVYFSDRVTPQWRSYVE